MSGDDQARLKERILALLPPDGSSMGNATVRAALGLELTQYQTVRDELVKEGIIELWRGRGGSVRRKVAEPAEELKKGKEATSKHEGKESKLYAPFHTSLRLWARDQSWTDYVVHKSAFGGKKHTGGTWTRPDFVVVGYRKFEYTPGIVRDVETFEVKTYICGIEAVFEAAAQSRAATKSYLAIHKTQDGPSPDTLDRIESECVRFGLGLLLFTDPKNYAAWEYRVEPNRQEPDPFNVEEFIRTQIPKSDQEKIRKWLR